MKQSGSSPPPAPGAGKPPPRAAAKKKQQTAKKKAKRGGSRRLRAEFRFGPGVSVVLEGEKSLIKPDLDFYRRLVERVALTGGEAVAALGPAVASEAAERAARSAASQEAGAKRGGRRRARPRARQTEVDREALAAFLRKKRPRKDHWSEIVCFIYFLHEHHGIKAVGAADVLACFEAVRRKKPKKVLPRVNAIKSRTGYVRTVAPGVFALTAEGTAFVEGGVRIPRKRRTTRARRALAAAAAPAEPVTAGAAVIEAPTEVDLAALEGAERPSRPDVKRGGRRGTRPERAPEPPPAAKKPSPSV